MQRGRVQTKARQYRDAIGLRSDLPIWMDRTLRKALSPNPADRYQTLSEFTHDLSHPNPAYLHERPAPLLERDPVKLWKILALFFAALSIYLAYRLSQI